MAGLARGAASLQRMMSSDGRSEQDLPSARKDESGASMDISGSLTGSTPPRNSFEPRLDFYRSVSLPVRCQVARLGEPTAAEGSGSVSQTLPVRKPNPYVSPIFARGSPAAPCTQPLDASSADESPLDAQGCNIAHSAPIAIEPQPHASRDLAAVYDDLAMTQSEDPSTANSSLVSGALPDSRTSNDEEFSRRYREWHDVVYASNF